MHFYTLDRPRTPRPTTNSGVGARTSFARIHPTLRSVRSEIRCSDSLELALRERFEMSRRSRRVDVGRTLSGCLRLPRIGTVRSDTSGDG
jgi:hypothetical protein